MAFGKCENCEQTVKAKQSGKRYILPLFFLFTGLLMLAYEHDLGKSLSVITVLGGISAVSGLVWLCVTGIRYFRS
jgi:cell division protein FtsW (lipid II flippase)